MTMELEDIYRVLSSEPALKDTARGLNPYFNVTMHKVEFLKTDQPEMEFFTVEHKFFACSAVCLDADQKVVLTRNPRFPLRDIPGDEFSWELPGGRSLESESPVECIRRELCDETGITADSFEPLLDSYFYPECSFGTERLYLYRAINPKCTREKEPEPEGVLETFWIDLDEAVEMVFRGKIKSSWTIIGLLAARMRLSHESGT